MDDREITRFRRYQDLQRYVRWADEDARRVAGVAALVEPELDPIIDDFYEEIRRHRDAHAVLTGGADQIQRLKATLRAWLGELFTGVYDESYVLRRWRVGLRHAEIGLNQVYTNAAMSRIRSGLTAALQNAWQGSWEELTATQAAIHKLLDLDLAIIEDAYQAAYLERQQRAERLVAIGQMAGGVAHELRNPLNVVKTSVYYLLHARNPSAQKTTEHLQRIERQVGLADRVITALSDFARLPFPQVQSVSVPEYLRETLEIAALPAGIDVELAMDQDLPPMLADPDQVRIVLVNLIRNACDAMPRGGKLSIHAAHEPEWVRIEVADTGEGIPPDRLARIMEPLFSTKTRGLGLGLAIARAIVDKHFGQLQVASQMGSGTTFTLRIPAASREARATAG